MRALDCLADRCSSSLPAPVVGAWMWATRERPIEVEVAAVTERPVGTQAAVLNASGYVTARRRATVSSKITGKVVEVNVEEGMAVTQGQVLARLDDSTAKAALALADGPGGIGAQGGQRERSAPRAGASDAPPGHASFARSGIATEADVDQAKAEVDGTDARITALRDQVSVAERQIELQQTDLDNTVIRAPFSGDRDLEGRAAGRDGVAGVGRRRLHAHRHLHDRRHELARDRSRRQRELHQPRPHRRSTCRPCSMRIRTGRFPAHVITHGADGGSAEGHGARPHRVRAARSANSSGHGREGHVPARGGRGGGARGAADDPRAEGGDPDGRARTASCSSSPATRSSAGP